MSNHPDSCIKCGKWHDGREDCLTQPNQPEDTELRERLRSIITRDGNSVRIPELLEAELDKLMALIATDKQRAVREAETRGVAWTVGVIDDLHIHRDYDLNAETDKIFKGMKNTIRDRYKFVAGIDPAPNYPIDVELQSHKEKEEE